MPAFDITADDGRRQWRSLLKATERQLVLSRAAPGMLAGLADYLFGRTTGHIGSLMTLITRGCLQRCSTASGSTRHPSRPDPVSPPPSPPGGLPLRQAGGSQPGARHHDR
jgi:hypothetical protein